MNGWGGGGGGGLNHLPLLFCESVYFRCFMFLCPMLLVMGVDLLQFLGIWLIKVTTEESFGLTRTKNQAPFPPRRNRVNHVDSS